MQKWEYRSIYADLPGKIEFDDKTKKDTQQYLNDLGREGWELVAVIKILADSAFSNAYRFFFKRAIS